MPAKRVKLFGGRIVEIKSVLLPNGNLVISRRMAHDRNMVDWVEVAPGTSDHKRWLPVAVKEADPRSTPEYKTWRAQIEATPEYQEWLSKQ